MAEPDWRNRIMVDSNIHRGAPHIRGTDVTVGWIIGSLAKGTTFGEILRTHPQLSREDIEAALRFAAETE